METNNMHVEILNGQKYWMPKESVESFKTTFSTYRDINENIDNILKNPDLFNKLNELVIKDEQERYIRELLIRNKNLQGRIEYLERSNNRREDTIIGLREEVGEANESVTWWSNRFNAVNRDKTLYQHRLNTANEYIESRKDNMIPEHYNDLKYILNECDLESSW